MVLLSSNCSTLTGASSKVPRSVSQDAHARVSALSLATESVGPGACGSFRQELDCMKVDNIKHRVGPFVLLLRHGVASDGFFLKIWTALLTFCPSRCRVFPRTGLRISGAVQSRSSCPWFECTSYVFSRRSTSRVTKFTLFLNVLFLISFMVVRLQFLHEKRVGGCEGLVIVALGIGLSLRCARDHITGKTWKKDMPSPVRFPSPCSPGPKWYVRWVELVIITGIFDGAQLTPFHHCCRTLVM